MLYPYLVHDVELDLKLWWGWSSTLKRTYKSSHSGWGFHSVRLDPSGGRWAALHVGIEQHHCLCHCKTFALSGVVHTLRDISRTRLTSDWSFVSVTLLFIMSSTNPLKVYGSALHSFPLSQAATGAECLARDGKRCYIDPKMVGVQSSCWLFESV